VRCYAAPLQGITTHVFRREHSRRFPGADRYYMPFFSPTKEHLITRKEWRELNPEHNAGVAAVPQLLVRNPTDCVWAIGELEALGYREINLNLGCPSGTVVSKGKGSGLLAHPEELERFLYEIFAHSPDAAITVKTRLGLREPEEFDALLEIFNRYPIAELTIHPRIQRDMYKVPVRLPAFEQALSRCRNPVCYNGDLVNTAGCAAFSARFPNVEAIMIGRGLIADPALARKLRGGPPATRDELRGFTQALFEGYCADYEQVGPAVQRMKELWFYLIRLFDGGEPYEKKFRRLNVPAEYETLEDAVFRDLPLRESVIGPF